LNVLITKVVLTVPRFAPYVRVNKNMRRINMMTIEEVERLVGNAFPNMVVFVDKNNEIIICTGEEASD
jgi:hypothetical protein